MIYEAPFRTIKRTAEQAIKEGVNLSFADFRKADLRKAQLDGAILNGACFWGADLSGADISGAYMHGCDLRLAQCMETCFAESIITASDCRGASFSKTIFTGCDLSGSHFSCPTFLHQDLAGSHRLKNCTYLHSGEETCILSRPPVVINGLTERIIILDRQIIIGSLCKNLSDYSGCYEPVIQAILRLRDGNFSDLNNLLTV